jgi:hypothetical protein
MKPQIIVTTRTVYGNPVIYPACDQSRVFAQLAGTKTLTLQSLKKIKALGYEISEKLDPSPLDALKGTP